MSFVGKFSISAALSASIFMLCGCGDIINEIDMEESAVPVVSELLNEQYAIRRQNV